VPIKKNSGPRTDWERNALWMVRVDRLQREMRRFGVKGKPRHISIKAACMKVSEELKKGGKFLEWTTIRSACERAKERFVLRFADYDQCPRLGIFTSSDYAPLRLPSTYSIPTFCDESSTPATFLP